MRKMFLAAVAVSGPCLGATASAAVYDWTLTGVYAGAGTLTTGAPDAGGLDVAAFTGTAAGETVTGLLGGDPGAAGAVSQGDFFLYDNILFPSDPSALVDPNGLLFATSGHPEASIWSNGGGDYEYVTAVDGRYDQDAATGEVFSVTAAPEPGAPGAVALGLLTLWRSRRWSGRRSRREATRLGRG